VKKLLTLLMNTTATLVFLAGPALASGDLPFKITVDGQPIDGTVTQSTSKAPALEAEKKGLAAVDIQIKFDGLGVRPLLNVSTLPPKVMFKPGENVRFLASFNYSAWVNRAEILIYETGKRSDDGIIESLEVSGLGAAEWRMPSDGPENLEYVLRVYDAEGRFDETLPLPLKRQTRVVTERGSDQKSVAPGYGEDRTAFRNIDVSGGVITVYGKNVPTDHDVTILGEPVPVDANGSFVVQRVLPAGQHGVDVAVLKDGEGLQFTREVFIPENEWFAVGLADFTGGLRFHNEIEAVRPGEFNDTYTKGRLAFYLKGKIKGRYILTAAADTGEQKLKHLFSGLDEKDPRAFLKRLDPDDYYPVYGDDSTAFEDAPTRGKFYVRFDRGPSHIMWGNFKSNITGTKFLRSERALYGASGVYRSDKPVANGDAATSLDVYAAQPGTLPQRDVLRGTGGSAYFLKHRDVTQGSETVSIEVRNATTGWVIERKQLKFGTDYEFDYVQGVIILRRPLSSSNGAGTENFLVASYEFSPAAGDIDGYVAGGRAQQWIGDHVRVGVTGLREKTEGANQTMYGADVRLEKTPQTYVEAEVAQSEGPGFGKTYSPDGGLTTQDNPSAGIRDRKAIAYRAEARVQFEDVTDGAVEGKLQAKYERLQRGFSSLDTEANEKKTTWGVEGDVKLSERVVVSATYSDAKSGEKQVDREGQAKARIGLTEHVSVEPFARHIERKRVDAADKDSGHRTDAGARLIYTWDADNEVYVFAQATVSRDGKLKKDNRVGVGGKKQITDRIGVSGEVSEGSLGFAAEGLFNYTPSDDGTYYLGYRLQADREGSGSWPFALLGRDMGTVVVGAQQRINEQWEVYGEDNYDMFGKRRSLTQVYGVRYSPTEAWLIDGGVEIGTVFDNTRDPATGKKNPDFDRKAVSLSASYKSEEGIDAKVRGEARFEDSEDNTRDLESYLMAAAVTMKTSENWRAIGSVDAVFTDAEEAVKESQYAEGSIGFAYRPAEGDKLNALVKYTYLYDNPGQDQVTIDGTKDGVSQRSHIFSADVSYDVIPQLTLGAKYGFRLGSIKERTAGARWEDSDAHLGILRADLHLVHEWDALFEGRMLWSPTTDQTELAFLVALYRQLGDNFKVGLGYNFGKFSDDLRDLSLDDGGVFVNVVGKF
jgi:hypothetical protein